MIEHSVEKLTLQELETLYYDIFGFIEGAMNGSSVRSIVRAKAATALTCLVYNIVRYVQINKYQPQLIASMG